MQHFFAFLLISLVFVVSSTEGARKGRTDIDKESIQTEHVLYCPRGEKWFECGTGCEKSCTHPKQPTGKKCKLPCIPYSCRCKPGRYRDNQGSGRCVRRKDCKKW